MEFHCLGIWLTSCQTLDEVHSHDPGCTYMTSRDLLGCILVGDIRHHCCRVRGYLPTVRGSFGVRIVQPYPLARASRHFQRPSPLFEDCQCYSPLPLAGTRTWREGGVQYWGHSLPLSWTPPLPHTTRPRQNPPRGPLDMLNLLYI